MKVWGDEGKCNPIQVLHGSTLNSMLPCDPIRTTIIGLFQTSLAVGPFIFGNSEKPFVLINTVLETGPCTEVLKLIEISTHPQRPPLCLSHFSSVPCSVAVWDYQRGGIL